MESAEIPDDEGARLAELAELGLVDGAEDEQLDRITAAAAAYFGSPICLVTLVDRDQQLFKSKIGLDVAQTDRDVSFCGHAILGDDPFIVTDARADERFADNPLVTGHPNIGFYAGYPVKGPGGHRLGTFCIIDQRPRTLNDDELLMLQVFGEAVRNRIAQMARTRWLGSPAQLLAAATNAAGIGLWEWDVQADVLTWDDKMFALYGIESADFTGAYEAWISGVHPDDAAEADGMTRRALSGEAEYDTQFRVIWPGGDIHWIRSKGTVYRDDSGKALSMLGLNWDITTEKAMEAELAAAAAQHATTTLLHHVEAAISELPIVLYGTGVQGDADTDRWLLGDSMRLLGVSKTSFEAGADILSNVVAGDREHGAREQVQVAPGIRSVAEQFRIAGDAGTEKWVQHVVMVDSAARTEIGALLDIDIATRLSLKLNESEKMEALGRLAGGIAHDFNNVLGVISNYASLARDAPTADAGIRADLSQIIAATERAASLTRQLLTAYRPPVGIHLTDLNERVVALSTFLSTLLGAAVDVSVYPCDGHAMVLIDPAELDRVIINLARNAGDAMPGGGQLAITVSRVDGQPGDRSRIVRMSMSDNGVGMHPDTARRVFEPFYTTKEFAPRAGLGLFTCFGIVTDAGGTIACTSVEGAGTTFTVDLPLLDADDHDFAADVAQRSGEQAPSDTERSARRDAGPRTSILIVDDDPALRASTQRILEHEGPAVTAVSTIAAAREALLARDFDLVITEIRLPDGDGMDFVRDLKGMRAQLPVVIWTAQPTIDAATRAVREGVAGFLTKPVAAADLIRATRDAIGQGRQLRLRNKLIASHMGDNEFLSELAGVDGPVSGLSQLTAAFESAISSLRVHFQPIVNAGDSSVFGYEALLRCDEPLFASPLRLVAAAELLGRTDDAGMAVRSAVAQVLSADPAPTHTIFVNVHPTELRSDVLAIATEPLLPFATQIVLEITEGAALDHGPGLEENLVRLRQFGYRVALDDLGEGYAGLSNLVRVNPDICKIDMSLVRNIDQISLKQDIVSAIVGMARPHRILVVAEGVETVAERAALRELGCDLLQGNLFAQPGPPFVVPRTTFDG